MPRTIDYTALTDPVSPVDVAAFKARAKLLPAYSNTMGIVQLVILAVFGTIFVFVMLGFALVIVATPLAIVLLPLMLVLVAGIVLVVVFAMRSGLGNARWERWMRLDRFAATNGLTFSPVDANPAYPGAIFSRGSSRAAIDHFRSADDRFLDYGNYRYVTSNGKNSTTHTWGFMALQLDRSLPHMVLDSTANNGLFGSNMPTFTKDQVLSLEGDFNNYFTLYCPKEYERDALYVFTPDLMALLIDEAAPFDVEIIDKWMFVYSLAALDLRQPAVHHRLLRIVDTVGAKTLTQTDRYTDERIANFAANVVAPPGQRLKRSYAPLIITLGVLLAMFFLGPILFGALVALMGG